MSEQRLRMLNTLLDTTPPSTFPTHITDTLNLLRQNAEEDLSNILHIQSIFPSCLPKKAALSLTVAKPKHSPVKAAQAVFGDSMAVLGQVSRIMAFTVVDCHEQVEEDIEAGVAVTDDLFLMEGVDASTAQLRSPQSAFSDEEREDSELDEGIHIPSKFSNKKTYEVIRFEP